MVEDISTLEDKMRVMLDKYYNQINVSSTSMPLIKQKTAQLMDIIT